MSVDPRAALGVFQAALERHLEACLNRHGEDDPAVATAYEHLVDAFEAYDGALYEATGEMTPLDLYDDEDDSYDDEDDDSYHDDDEDSDDEDDDSYHDDDEDSDDDDDEDDDHGDDDEDDHDHDDDDVDDSDDEEIDDHDDEDGDADHVYLGLDALDFDESDLVDLTRERRLP